MSKFDFVDCLRGVPIGLWPIGGRCGLDFDPAVFDPAGAGVCRRAVR